MGNELIGIWIGSRTHGDIRTTTVTLTGDDDSHVRLIDALEIAIMASNYEASVAPLVALRDALCDRVGLVKKS
jgi:hypothetical protein